MIRKVVAIAGAVAVVLLAVWYAVAWRPIRHKLVTAQEAVASAQSNEMELGSQLAVLHAHERRLTSERGSIQALLAELPSTVAVDTFIDQLSALAAKSGISLANVSQTVSGGTPSGGTTTAASAATAAPTGPVSTLSLSFSVDGSYTQILAFVGGLQRLPRLVDVSTLAITADSAASTAGGGSPAGGLSAQITASAYFDDAALPGPVAALAK